MTRLAAPIVFVLVLAASVVRGESPADAPHVRSLEGTEQTQTEGRTRAEVPGTVTAVDARAGNVAVRAAGAELRLDVPPATAATLRPGAPVIVEVVLVVRPPAPGTPAGGPAPAIENAPRREVREPAPDERHRVDPNMVGPRPER
jgi:hypothetical protein